MVQYYGGNNLSFSYVLVPLLKILNTGKSRKSI